MFRQMPSEREGRSWLYVGGWTLIIYTTIPLARAMQRVVSERWGRDAFMWFVLFAIALALASALRYLWRQAASLRVANLAWLIGIGTILALWTWELRSASEEALHFVQYGLLSVLVYRAMLHRVRDVTIFLSATFVCGLIGALDEVIQWVTPRRFFDFRDIWLNFAGAALVQMGIALGIRPPLIATRPTRAGCRRAARLAALLLLFLGLCASNTLVRVDGYASRIPGLAFLRTNESVMIEYGYRYEDADIGVFFSRFPPDLLARQDRERAAEVAAILDRYQDPRRYGEFLRIYTPAVDPFAHEARVHLFRRDRYRGEAARSEEGTAAHARHYTVAYREHMILEKYFSNTLHASRYAATGDYLAYMREQQIPDQPYVSAVSSQLVTRWRERHLWLMIVMAVIALEVGWRYGACRTR